MLRRLMLCIILSLWFSAQSSASVLASDFQLAPTNPKFLDVLNRLEDGGKSHLLETSFYGYIPGPQLPPSFVGYNPLRSSAPLPSKYDLRNTDKLSPVRNQGACGSCWAFASFGSLESFLKPAETWNFSEQHLIDNHGFDWGPCDGGNSNISAAYLLRWDGPQRESDFPYAYQNPATSNPVKHVRNILWLPPRTSDLANDAIKQAIMTYGAVYTSYYHNDTYYNSSYRSYYYTGTANSGT